MKLDAAIKRFELAVRADAWKGAQPPDAIPSIEREYLKAKRGLHSTIARYLGEQQTDDPS